MMRMKFWSHLDKAGREKYATVHFHNRLCSHTRLHMCSKLDQKLSCDQVKKPDLHGKRVVRTF